MSSALLSEIQSLVSMLGEFQYIFLTNLKVQTKLLIKNLLSGSYLTGCCKGNPSLGCHALFFVKFLLQFNGAIEGFLIPFRRAYSDERYNSAAEGEISLPKKSWICKETTRQVETDTNRRSEMAPNSFFVHVIS